MAKESAAECQRLPVVLLQYGIVWNAPEENIAIIRRLLASATSARGSLVVLPEMATTGFSFVKDDEAQRAAEYTVQALTDLAREYEVSLIASYPAAGNQGFTKPRNRLALISANGPLFQYDKIHLFSYAHEDSHYEAGTSIAHGELNSWRITPFICYDLRFPLPFCSIAAQTDLFVVVANWPASRSHHWRSLLLARAIENQAFVIGVNRTGEGGGLLYQGDSLVVSPYGEILLDCGSLEGAFSLSIDKAQVNSFRSTLSCLTDARSVDALELRKARHLTTSG